MKNNFYNRASSHEWGKNRKTEAREQKKTRNFIKNETRKEIKNV